VTGAADRVRRALDRVDPSLNAFITPDERAVARAAADPPGRLRGLTLAVKDNIDTAGLRTTYGSLRHAEHVPRRSAQVVEDLVGEGAVILGKANLNEYAYGVSGHNPHFGTILSPADRERTAGGSSGGSAAAVAAGVCDIGVGTDTSGSVRIPAACCGVYGFKAAHGAYPMRGVFPLAARFDSLGFFAADVPTLARVLDIEVPAGVAARVPTLGEDVTIPPLPDEHWVLFREQAYAVHREQMVTDPFSFADDVRLKLSGEVGDVEQATRVMAAWRREVEAALAGVDVVVSEVFAGPPPTVEAVLNEYREGSRAESLRLMAFTPVANALGWPAMTVPTDAGPRHLLGRPRSEAAMLALAARMGLGRSGVLERSGGAE
jgi:Asp-tRNA(Asn)/Glu-tRNA(Gln) amidotransferase A subunit family amidase